MTTGFARGEKVNGFKYRVVVQFDNVGASIGTSPSTEASTGAVRNHVTEMCMGDERTILAMLRGTNLDNKLWPYAFNYYLQICGLLTHGDRGVHFEGFTGQSGDVRRMWTFGCPVVPKPPVKRNGLLVQNFRRQCFLGFTVTTTQIYYYDMETKRVKTAYTIESD
jgi:hypothetical protein